MSKIYNLFLKSKNSIVDCAYVDLSDWCTKEEMTDKRIIEEIGYKIGVAQENYDQWGKDSDYSKIQITNAKKFLNKLKGLL